MLLHISRKTLTYTGKQLSSLWAYKNFHIQGDSMVVFRGPCHIDFKEMVDLEDVLAASPIYGSDMLHFIVEHFDMDLEKMILRQRLFMALIQDALSIPELVRKGDDLFWGEKKLSISIATLSPVSTMMHTALNIVSKGTPVETIGLQELGVKDFYAFGEQIGLAYQKELAGIKGARCKVRGVL